MLTAYLEQAVAAACIERMEDGRYFARIPDFHGLWAEGDTPEQCRKELRSALEDWLIAALREDEELPVLNGIDLNFGGRRWSAQAVAAASSAS